MKRSFEPQKIRALAIDLDGTALLPGGKLGKRTEDCLKNLISKGMQIIIATGRAIEATKKYSDAIGAEGPMVLYNGAEIVDVPSSKILYVNLISLDVIKFTADMAYELGIHYQVYLPAGISPDTGKKDINQNKETLLINRDGPEADYYHQHTEIIPIVKDLRDINTLPADGCIKGMYIVDPILHDEIRRRLKERFNNQINIIRSYPTFLEVLNIGVSKGEGLKIAMQYRGLNPDEVIAFGDEENDLSMFPVAGFAGAPQNARDKIKDAADLVFGPNTEEGLAQYLEKVFL